MGINYYNQIQAKRTKMLYLVLLLIIYQFFFANGNNITYIVKKEKGVFSPSCIAEELERYAGIGWIHPIPNSKEGLPTVVTKYIPTIENDFNCQFSANSHCNIIWSLRDWYIDHTSPKTKEFISDSRWEDLPTIFISNTSKEFEEKIELENNFKTSFSIRADGVVELIICSGWNPYKYPCYYFNIGHREIYFKQYPALPTDLKDDFKSGYADIYKAYSDILSYDEWRSFELSSDASGVLKLIDVNRNRILIEHTIKDPLTSLYMFMRSANCSLWKIHQNSFLYTNTTQISRLGPQISLPYKDLCVSVLVKTCSNCQMNFFYMNKTKKALKSIGPTTNEEWVEIKLKEENTQYDKLNIFVETKLVHNDSSNLGFWGIDNVRVCNENEVKVLSLKLDSPEEKKYDSISCQLIKNPSWRPKKLVYDQIKDFPIISSTSTQNSIHLSWSLEDPTQSMSYFIDYEGNDICLTEPYNLKRLKSNGFVSTKRNEIILDNLVPYTVYNITVSTILHENNKKIFVHTLATVEPSLEELPSNIHLKPLDTSINVSWDHVNCSKIYGTLAYALIVSNSSLNFSKEISMQTDNSYVISGLQPYTHYTLNILTARNGRNLFNRVHVSNFSFEFRTMPGVALPPENMEIYSMEKNMASLRFDLPRNSNGIAREIQVNRCNSLSYSKCRTSISVLKHCSLWPQKYCVDAEHLIQFQSYTFKVSLKNVNSPSFGKEASINGFANDQVPGKPTNITYRTVDCQLNADYCNLNVTWLHPYNQNGEITSFEIILNSTEQRKDAQHDKYIHEIYRIENHTYYYDYTYQIKSLLYSSYYKFYLRSVNTAYKSELAEIDIKTDNLGDHIDQSPKLITKSDSTLLFKIPYLDKRLEFYTLTVVVQDYNKTRKIDNELLKTKKIADNLCNSYGDSWISQVIKVDSNTTENIIIGNAEKERLQPNKKYCITFIITNQYRGSEHDVVYYEKLKTMDVQHTPKEINSGSSSNHLLMLLLILLVIPVGFFIYRYFRKKQIIKESMQNNELVYETLPCEEIEHTNSMNGKVPQAFLNNTNA